jgi:SagB-type dehydrogenase family enzyme
LPPYGEREEGPTVTEPTPEEQVLAYHRASKHHLSRYAAGPDHLDWANQPDPFRTFAGAPVERLPLLADALSTTWAELLRGGATRRRADINSVAILFELSLGLSAWKEHRGSRWGLRCNPSSGNLHPTEGYVVVPELPGLAGGVYHYVSRDHVLERRRTFTPGESAHLAGCLPPGSFLVGLSSVHWREAWKYGVRAFRYCQHDAGHAVGAIRYAAGCLGWSARLLAHLGDDAVSGWLSLAREGYSGVDALDREHPDALVLVGPPPLRDILSLPAAFPGGVWLGEANRLSAEHVRWQGIEAATRATWQPALVPEAEPVPEPLPAAMAAPEVLAATLIRQRRSCLALDGRTSVEVGDFYRMLDRLLPRPGVPPWDVLPWAPLVHAVVFVHRVRGLEPGLYLFARSESAVEELRAISRPGFGWRRVEGCPEHLALFLLAEGDLRKTACTVSCHQEIASDGAFSLGMVVPLRDTLTRCGPWWYRRLFWEAGVLGQVLYLEAEAAQVRGTGIGCYFDDACHQTMGWTGEEWQDLYHFTVGGPVEDARLRTLAPYGHLRGR